MYMVPVDIKQLVGLEEKKWSLKAEVIREKNKTSDGHFE